MHMDTLAQLKSTQRTPGEVFLMPSDSSALIWACVIYGCANVCSYFAALLAQATQVAYSLLCDSNL